VIWFASLCHQFQSNTPTCPAFAIATTGGIRFFVCASGASAFFPQPSHVLLSPHASQTSNKEKKAMAPKKATSSVTVASAADFFTRGKKPTTIERVIAPKKTTTLSRTPSPASLPPSKSRQLQQQLHQQKLQHVQEQKKLHVAIAPTVIVIEDDDDDDRAGLGKHTDTPITKTPPYAIVNKKAHKDVDEDDETAWTEHDLGSLDDILWDDLDRLPLTEIKAASSPLPKPTLYPRVTPAKRSYSHLESTSVAIKRGSMLPHN